MTERFTSDLLFIVVVLLIAALLGFIIGYLIKKHKHQKSTLLEDEITQLKSKLENCQHEKQLLLAGDTFDAKAAASALGRKIVLDDLKIIEGIGEKIESLLKGRGIDTWLKLSRTSPEKIKEILLEDGGPQYKIHEPKTWPHQSLLMVEGKWSDLKKYQDELVGGK
jgi:predicted flap endonuclease-1-like 5' DNA nuclease